MYKISEVSLLLGIEKTEIFAKMISHKHLLESHITKIDGVTYFNEKGFEILGTLLNVKSAYFESDSVDLENDHTPSSANHKDTGKKKQLGRNDKEYFILKDKISIMIDELAQLDNNIEVLDSMIKTYQSKLIKEIELFGKAQSQMIKKLEKSLE